MSKTQTWGRLAQDRELQAVLKSGDVNQSDKNGVTPLHSAVRFRNPGAVRTLLKHGADAPAGITGQEEPSL